VQSSLGSGALGTALDELCREPAMLVQMGTSAQARARADASQVIATHILAMLNLQ
jgi:hypothetical protein